MKTIETLLLSGFSYKQNYYKKLIDTAPENWKFNNLNYFEILRLSKNNNYHEAIYKYMQINKLDKINIIAHSLGGAYAINFAFYHPEKINHLYLLNTLGVKHKMLFSKFLLLAIYNKTQNLSKHFQDDLKGLINIIRNPLIHLALLKYVKTDDLENKSRRLKVKTTIIWADKDFLLPVKDGKKLHSLIKNSRFVRLRNLGHDWPIFSPELFWNNIKNLH